MASDNPLLDVPPDEFVKARNALVQKLRGAGKADEAKRVAALRRPSTPLWIVNQLSRRAAGRLEELIDATHRAARAQVQGRSGDELREATHAQRQALHGLLGEAEKVAASIGTRITPEIQRRIHDTLQSAASADPKGLREGTLEEELSAAGFGALLGGSAAVVAKAAATRSVFRRRADEQKNKAAEQKEKAAEQKAKIDARRADILRRRDLRHAEQTSRHLETRARQLERIALRAREAAESAKERAGAARAAANAAAARLLDLRR